MHLGSEKPQNTEYHNLLSVSSHWILLLTASSILEPPVRSGSNFTYNYKGARVAISSCRHDPNWLPTKLLWFETLFHNIIITINTE